LIHGPSLRDGADVMQLVADPCHRVGDKVPFVVHDTHPDGAPTAALELSPDSGHEHGSAADGFAVVLFVVKAQIEIPPVVKERDEVSHQSARRKFARGKAIPSPLVLEFVKDVFGVGAVAVVLGHDLGGKSHLI